MIVPLVTVVALLAMQSVPVIRGGELTALDVAEAVARVPRFAPDRFSMLPPSVRDALVAMGCHVPQPSLTAGPSNVIQGELAAPGQRDWAALCSDGTVSVIRVVWGGPARCDDRLAARQDSDVMVAVSPGVLGYDRTLTIATVEQINRDLVRYDQTLPEPASHDAIEDGSGSASRLYYCRAGHWASIPGAG